MKAPRFNPDWPENVMALYRHDMQEIWDQTIALHIWNQYHNQLDLYLSLVDGDTHLAILDVGCAQGTLALRLAERGHHVWAMDIRQQFLDYAATRYESGDVHFVCGNVMEVNLAERFDLIFANQIVEHLVYPLEFTKRLAGFLKSRGCLVMTTPNGAYVKNSLPSYSELGDPSKYHHLQLAADADGHFFAYLADELKQVFDKVGLTQIRVHYFETPWISGHMKVRYLHSFVPGSLLRFLDHQTLRVPGLRHWFAHQLMIIGSRPA